MKNILLLIICMQYCIANAQVVSITQSNVPYVQDFDSLEKTATTGSVMPHGWYFVSASGNSYSVNHGSSVSGAVYSYGSIGDSDRAMGTLATNSNPNPMFGASIKNNTGAAISSIYISFWIEQWRKGNSSFTDSSEFSVSFNAISIDDATALWNKIPELNLRTVNTTALTGALDGNSADNREFVSYHVNLVFPVPDGFTIWIRWVDMNIPDSDDGLSIDEFILIANPVAATLMPVQNFTATYTPGLDSASIEWSLPANFDSITQRVLVFVKEGAAITQGTPSRNSAYYLADPDFSGSGTPYEHDTDAKNIYNGTGTEVTLTGFHADSTYYLLAYVVDNVFNNYSSGASTILSNVANINISQIIPSSFCPGDLLTVFYDITGDYNQGNEFIVQISDVNGSFNSQIILDTITSVTAGVIHVNIPQNSDAGSDYYVRIISTQPQLVSNYASLTIHQVPFAQVLTLDTSICQGDSVLLNANAGTGLSYEWLRDNNTVPGATNAELYATVEGSYYVMVTNMHGCKATSTGVNVIIHPLPAIPGITQSGNILFSTLADHYQWYFEDSLLTGENQQSLIPFAEGTYKVEVTDSNGCSRVSQAFLYTQTGIATPALPYLKVFPNPAINTVYITAQLNIDIIILTDITGKEIFNVPAVNTNVYNLDVSLLNNGFYILTAISGNKIAIRQIIKE